MALLGLQLSDESSALVGGCAARCGGRLKRVKSLHPCLNQSAWRRQHGRPFRSRGRIDPGLMRNAASWESCAANDCCRARVGRAPSTSLKPALWSGRRGKPRKGRRRDTAHQNASASPCRRLGALAEGRPSWKHHALMAHLSDGIVCALRATRRFPRACRPSARRALGRLCGVHERHGQGRDYRALGVVARSVVAVKPFTLFWSAALAGLVPDLHEIAG